MATSRKSSVDRRKFLRGAVTGAAALAVDTSANAQQSQPLTQPLRSSAAPLMAKETDPGPISSAEVLTEDRSGSDFMVDVI